MDSYWLIAAAVFIMAFLVFATRKHWISWKGGGIVSLTAFHDFLPKDKQEAIEIVMEQKAGKKLQEQESGKKKEEGDANSKPQTQNLV